MTLHDDLTRMTSSVLLVLLVLSCYLFFRMFITPKTLLKSLICLLYYPYPPSLECKLHERKVFCLFLFMLSTQGRQEDLVPTGCLISTCRVNRFLNQADGGTAYYIHDYWAHRERKDPEFNFKPVGIQIL